MCSSNIWWAYSAIPWLLVGAWSIPDAVGRVVWPVMACFGGLSPGCDHQSLGRSADVIGPSLCGQERPETIRLRQETGCSRTCTHQKPKLLGLVKHRVCMDDCSLDFWGADRATLRPISRPALVCFRSLRLCLSRCRGRCFGQTPSPYPQHLSTCFAVVHTSPTGVAIPVFHKGTA